MVEESIAKRFGTLAIEKGLITKDQFIDAMAVQIENDLEGITHWRLGSVLNSMGYMTNAQIIEVLEEMGVSTEKLQEE